MKGPCSEEPETLARRHTTCSPCTLVRRCLRKSGEISVSTDHYTYNGTDRQKTDRLTDLGARHHNKRLHPRARVVALLFAEPRVNDVDDAINGQ